MTKNFGRSVMIADLVKFYSTSLFGVRWPGSALAYFARVFLEKIVS